MANGEKPALPAGFAPILSHQVDFFAKIGPAVHPMVDHPEIIPGRATRRVARTAQGRLETRRRPCARNYTRGPAPASWAYPGLRLEAWA